MENTQNIIRNSIEFIGESRVNKSNKALMIDKILSYSPTLENGIEKYKIENRRFIVLILFSVLFINFSVISLPCCLAATFFLVKILQLIRYRSVYNIVKKMGRDIAYKGIYNKGIVEEMVKDFKSQYGEDIIEYYELVYMVEKYEAFVVKIEEVINKIMHKERDDENWKEESLYRNHNKSSVIVNSYDSFHNENSSKDSKLYDDSKYSVLYKNEEGEIKKVNRAIEFFDDNSKSTDAVVLKGGNKKDKNLTVYLYKKNNELQNNAL